jgi:capsule biosynthesis phosphatase
MRICFDLDNTLVTYPTVCGDYTTVKPIKNMIDFIHDLHKDGNTIIIHTARRMNTHSGNIGKVNRDIGKITFDTLERFNIPYDEIVFGKPYADVYIDDRAINPYKNDFKMFGLFQYKQRDTIINALDTNKFNNLSLKDSHIIKSGDYELLKGQIFYYQNLPKDIHSFFPQLYSVKHNNNIAEIEIEYIKGIPMFTLFNYQLLREDHFKNLLMILDIIHMSKSTSPVPSVEQMSNNYLLKFKKRISDKSVYTFENVDEVSRDCIGKLTDYITSPYLKCVDVIHGDLWFSNIIITYEGEIKLIDMRGSVDGFLTLGGDPLYDYAKIYQSLLGYDSILYNKEYPSEYAASLIKIFHTQMISNNINIEHVKTITKVLIIGTLPFIEDNDVRNRIWNWVNLIL